MPTNISADIYALMTSCWNTIPSSRPTINQVQQRLKQSIKSDILATPRVSTTGYFYLVLPILRPVPSINDRLLGTKIVQGSKTTEAVPCVAKRSNNQWRRILNIPDFPYFTNSIFCLFQQLVLNLTFTYIQPKISFVLCQRVL